jgi:Carboxypeptidase regulatory-like domain
VLRIFSRVSVSVFVALLVFSIAVSTFAGVGGRISGTVKDSSGAVVPRATVSVTNLDTGVRQKLTTDEKGIFVFLDVAVGRYDLEIDSPGSNRIRGMESRSTRTPLC